MNKRRIALAVSSALIVLSIVLAASIFLAHSNVQVLNAKGTIAQQERSLMIIAAALMALVVIPVLALTAGIVWKYRIGNKKKAAYTPEWDHSRAIEAAWWIIPSVLIAVLSVITWLSAHSLDPFKPLPTATQPLVVDVVALDWKWLFIYPQQHIASVNFVQFPVNTPVAFHITADAPMNSFWIPQLGGQIYAMPGMSTQLHLQASATGDYAGSSANISGAGFAGMRFTARASSLADFNSWVHNVQASSAQLMAADYEQLIKPSQNDPVHTYGKVQDGLYDTIIMKYTMPQGSAGMSQQGMQ